MIRATPSTLELRWKSGENEMIQNVASCHWHVMLVAQLSMPWTNS
jgi:hypothetical protein